MIGTSCLPHTTLSSDRLFYVICKGGKRRAFKVKWGANEVQTLKQIQTKHKINSGTLAEHFALDLRVCLSFSVSHDRMWRSNYHYFSIIMTDWLRTRTRTQTIIRPQQAVWIITHMSQIWSNCSQKTCLQCYLILPRLGVETRKTTIRAYSQRRVNSSRKCRGSVGITLNS